MSPVHSFEEYGASIQSQLSRRLYFGFSIIILKSCADYKLKAPEQHKYEPKRS